MSGREYKSLLLRAYHGPGVQQPPLSASFRFLPLNRFSYSSRAYLWRIPCAEIPALPFTTSRADLPRPSSWIFSLWRFIKSWTLFYTYEPFAPLGQTHTHRVLRVLLVRGIAPGLLHPAEPHAGGPFVLVRDKYPVRKASSR